MKLYHLQENGQNEDHLNKISQSHKDTYHVFLHMCDLGMKTGHGSKGETIRDVEGG
jgi:hypothetical protein